MPLALHKISIAVDLQRGELSGAWEVAKRDSGWLSFRLRGLLVSAARKQGGPLQ